VKNTATGKAAMAVSATLLNGKYFASLSNDEITGLAKNAVIATIKAEDHASGLKSITSFPLGITLL